MSKIIGFCGKIGSGKTTVARALAMSLGWVYIGFGDYVRQVAADRGLSLDRSVLQRIGKELLENDPEVFCRSVLESGGWTTGNNLILDGVRHLETLAIIREIAGASNLYLIFVSIEEGERLRRIQQRSGNDLRFLEDYEAHSSESQIETTLKARADFTVDGTLEVALQLEQINTLLMPQWK